MKPSGYIVTYGTQYLRDYGDGWTTWTYDIDNAWIIADEVDGGKVAFLVGGSLIPVG